MSLPLSLLLSWNTASPGDAAVEWHAGADALSRAAESSRSAVTGVGAAELSGSIRDAADDAVQRVADSLGRDGHRLSIVAAGLEDGEQRLTEATSALRDRVDSARSIGLEVREDGVCVVSVGTLIRQLALTTVTPGLSGDTGVMVGLGILYTGRVRRAMAAVTEADETTARSLGRTHPGGLGDGPTSASAATGGTEWSATMSDGVLLESGPDHGMSAVIGYGADLAEAEHVIVLVPGTGSSLDDRESVSAQADRARALLAGATVPTTVLVAMHDAPSHLVAAAGDRFHPPAAEHVRTVAARAAESAVPGAKISVAGYSHGAVITAQAARGPGLRADSVVLIGSPGAGPEVRSTRDMKLIDGSGRRHPGRDDGGSDGCEGDGRVLVAADPADIVTRVPGLGVHGADPADPAFGAGIIELPESGRRVPGTAAHGEYFTEEEAARGITKALESAVGE